MSWLARQLVAFMVAMLSVLSLLAAGQRVVVEDYTNDASRQNAAISASSEAVLDVDQGPSDGQDRESEEDPATNLFTPPGAAPHPRPQQQRELRLALLLVSLSFGRQPQTAVFRPPRG